MNENIKKKDKIVLHLAVFNRNVVAVELLLKEGAKVNIVDNEGNTPIHWLMATFDSDPIRSAVILDMLCKHYANLNVLNWEGWSALHLAARKNMPTAIR